VLRFQKFLSFGILIGLAFSGAFAAEKSAKQDTLKVVGRLQEIPGAMPPNDLYNYVYIFKYRIIKVIQGDVKAKEILVGQYNPLIARSNIKDKMQGKVSGSLKIFKAGDKHELVLVSPLENAWKEAIEDEYFDESGPRYFAIKTDAFKK